MSFSTDQREGFEEILGIAGRDFICDDQTFRGVLKQVLSEDEDYDLTPGDDDAASLTGLASEIPALALKIGSSINDSDGYLYRVVSIRRPPNKPTIRLVCSVTSP